MKLQIKEYVYELSIDEVLKQLEFYDNARLALESAMDDIFEGEIACTELWLSKPVLLHIPIDNIDYWRVWVLSGEGIVREHTIKIRKLVVLTRG